MVQGLGNSGDGRGKEAGDGGFRVDGQERARFCFAEI